MTKTSPASLFETEPERLAEHAENLPAFRGLKLYALREQVATILAFVGRDGVFRQYTKHDITHVDRMLQIAAWLVPESSRPHQTPADWLLLTLAIYFHDLGMVVTKDEFDRRNESGFREYSEQALSGDNYRERVEALGADDAEKFLYQEFVRANHATRIRNWIGGKLSPEYGAAVQLAKVANDLLAPLPREFREDLGRVCESHHLDDLEDFDIYPVSRPYGESDAETANVHYAALILRTADLLHITRDRTPTIEARLINPQDPISQREWEKQQAVTNVRAKVGKNAEGDDDPSAVRTAIEIFATFTSAEAFFGLNAYINYARDQLRQSHQMAQLANRRRAATQEFPWRDIDDSNVKAEGFIPKQFEFQLDQARILNLLTGHTLYNDSGVVLRELVQNSLDAVRLRALEERDATSSFRGTVAIRWDPETRQLDILDNGTGMTQQIIEDHLLKVGSSRYQDDQFTKRFPGFSAISRFGIGVLASFMVSDAVDVYTRSSEEDSDGDGRHVALRSLHGRYLVRLLDAAGCAKYSIDGGGTLVRLSLRPDAELPDVLDTVRRWIVIPRCDVSVQIGDAAPEAVGVASVAEALRSELESVELAVTFDEDERGATLVRSAERSGVSVAFASRWSEFFHVWQLVTFTDSSARRLRLGTSIEGIRVENGTPGYDGVEIAALANAVGPSAPKTNVARSGIEATRERDGLLTLIYQLLAEHVTGEITAMTETRGFSVTKASQEAGYLLAPLLGSGESPEPLDSDLRNQALRRVPFALVDGPVGRSLMAPEELSEQEIWTIDAPAFASIESTLRSVQKKLSLAEVVDALGVDLHIPDGLILASPTHGVTAHQLVFSSRELTELIVNRDLPQVSGKWSVVGEPMRWIAFGHTRSSRFEALEAPLRARPLKVIYAPRGEIGIEGAEGFSAVEFFSAVYLMPDTPIAQYVLAFSARAGLPVIDERRSAYRFLHALLSDLIVAESNLHLDPSQLVARRLGDLEMRTGAELAEMESIVVASDLIEAVAGTDWQMFSTLRWRRRAEPF